LNEYGLVPAQALDRAIRKRGRVKQHDVYLEMRLRIDSVFEHYAAQSEYYKHANLVQRFAMKDSFYRLSMELLARIIGPFGV